MNYNIAELVARMNAGESADAIADEMTAALTAANKQYQAEQEAAKRAAEDAMTKQAKFNEMAYILRQMYDYVEKYYPATAAAIVEPMRILCEDDKEDVFEDIVKIVVEALDAAEEREKNPNKVDPMEALISMMLGMDATPKKSASAKTKTKSEDEILSQFLSSICH